ncbi:unnamed protein product [Laminaria digitata]
MASFVGPKTVVVNGVEYTADHINIAVGGRPSMPDIPGSEFCIDRQEAFFSVVFLNERPKRVAVVGAGYIAVEILS